MEKRLTYGLRSSMCAALIDSDLVERVCRRFICWLCRGKP